MSLLRRVNTSLPQVVGFTRRSLKSLKFAGDSLDSSSSPALIHGIHVFHCPDTLGIVAKLSECIASRGGNILGADIFVPQKKQVFYSRSDFVFDPAKWPRVKMEEDFLKLSKMFNAMKSVVRVPTVDPKYKIAVLASKQDGRLPVDITCIIRYMQVLSGNFLSSYGKDIINIHHGLLPSFKGGNPSKQAFDAGVKLIGATSHFVTEELDAGPIIEQMALLRISGVSGEGCGVTIEGSAPVIEEAIATPPVADTKASAAEDDDDDDDVDLFGEETEEEKKAAEERAAAMKASGKKKESGKSSILMDIKPWDDETDMKKLEEAVRSVQMEGLVWGASKLVPVGYGIKKLQILLSIVDDLVSVDTLIEDYLTAEPVNDVERVSHRDNLQSFIQKSENLEKQCLAMAIKSYCELRVLPYEENKTVVF
ncbi:unnamed protein product [Camellia sinensis]